jgi:hypothetical protein
VLLYFIFKGAIFMTELISNYTHSRALVRQRITELSQLRRKLLECGDSRRAQELDLDRRIRLLYEEHGELQQVISHLASYRRG